MNVQQTIEMTLAQHVSKITLRMLITRLGEAGQKKTFALTEAERRAVVEQVKASLEIFGISNRQELASQVYLKLAARLLQPRTEGAHEHADAR